MSGGQSYFYDNTPGMSSDLTVYYGMRLFTLEMDYYFLSTSAIEVFAGVKGGVNWQVVSGRAEGAENGAKSLFVEGSYDRTNLAIGPTAGVDLLLLAGFRLGVQAAFITITQNPILPLFSILGFIKYQF